MSGLLTFLSNKKTYLVAIVWAIAQTLALIGVIDPHMAEQIEGYLLPLGLAALRAGVKKSGPVTP